MICRVQISLLCVYIVFTYIRHTLCEGNSEARKSSDNVELYCEERQDKERQGASGGAE